MEFINENTRFGSMTIAELRGELKKRGAKLTGRKKDLIERLQSYERNFNFGNNANDNIMIEYDMTVPAESTYKDLHQHMSIPPLNIERINSYLQPLNKKVEKESINLATKRFLVYIKTVQDNNVTFFKSQCRAEMKKTVRYNLDMSVDSHGCVQECQCDCGSGMGPEAHCKHIIALMYALHIFCNKAEIFTEHSCTQQLQTFHLTKAYKGSPLKACDLRLSHKRKRDGDIAINFDPSPVHLRNMVEYQHYFRNVILNFKNVGVLPVSHLFPPANIPALCLDHDCMAKTPQDMFVKSLGLAGTTKNEQEEINNKTIDQSFSKDWGQMRCMRLNSSDFGRICKLTGKTDKGLYASSLTVFTDIQAAPLKHGRKYEKVALEKFCNVTGLDVVPCGTVVSLTHPFLASSPDGLVGKDYTIEIKCPFAVRDSEISTLSVPYLNLNGENDLTLNQNHNYYFQVQGQLLCTERNACYFCVFTFTIYYLL